jgi:ligand-binding SRPBCC domain-containing protein
MKIYRIQQSQFLPLDLEAAWSFFATPQNLEAMTPDFLRFKILSDVPDTVHSGLIIEYRIQAVAGIPMRWLTEIKHVEPLQRFVDEQRLGPFPFWYHEHRFKAVKGGIVMEDEVHYQMPFGLFGPIVHTLFIRHRLLEIFRFRKAFLAQRFATGQP